MGFKMESFSGSSAHYQLLSMQHCSSEYERNSLQLISGWRLNDIQKAPWEYHFCFGHIQYLQLLRLTLMALGKLRRNKYITAVRRLVKASHSTINIRPVHRNGNVTFTLTTGVMTNPRVCVMWVTWAPDSNTPPHTHTHPRRDQNKYKHLQPGDVKHPDVLMVHDYLSY